MVALALLLAQVPPPASVRFMVEPTQTCVGPEIPVGLLLTVTVLVVKQPLPSVYVIIDVPDVAPVTMPVVPPIVACVVLLLQVPPVGDEDNVVVDPMQTVAVPVITPGFGFTVTVSVTEQPVKVEVWVMITAPGDTPLSVLVDPGVVTVAIPGILLLQLPLDGSESVIVDPLQTVVGPEMAGGLGLTVTEANT